MPSIASLTDVSDNHDLIGKFLRVMAREGTTMEQLAFPVNNRTARRNLAAYLATGCPKVTVPDEEGVSTPATRYDLAHMILGRDFISPEEITAKRLDLAYNEEQLDMLEASLPSREDLEWLRDNSFILVPGPARPLSLLDVRTLTTTYFYSKVGGWYEEPKQHFSRDDKAEIGWIALRKEAVPNSYSKSWDEQRALLSGVEIVPNAGEAVWCITMYKAVRNINLFRSAYVRTSSVDSLGRRVCVGYFDEIGLGVDGYWDDGRNGTVGLASARKF